MVISVKGRTAEEELKLGIRLIFEEKCGLAAAVNLPDASNYVYDILYDEEHRGEDGAGIVSVKDGGFYERRRIGSILEQFSNIDLSNELPGKVAMGQNRYATHGSYKILSNVGPFVFQETKYGIPIAIGHNGTLVNFKEIKQDIIQKGALFQSTTDTELIGHLIAHSSQKDILDAIVETLDKIQAAYSLLILTPDKLFAIRDRFGVRPLCIGKIGDGFLVASEDDAFNQYLEAERIRDIKPGEMIVFEKGRDGFKSIQYAVPDEHYCIFEGIYFSSPRATYHGYYHEDFRQEEGKQIYKENPDLSGDFILPVLDSGKHPAIGLSKIMGTELYKEYFLRRHNPKKSRKRSYTAPTTEERIKAVRQKLHLRKDKIQGRRVIVVDDSIVRMITMRIICEILRTAGASYITVVIASPPIKDICPNGMDHQAKSELIAYGRSIEDIRKECGADKLVYLTLEGLYEVVSRTYKCGICTGCFGGKYPVIPK